MGRRATALCAIYAFAATAAFAGANAYEVTGIFASGRYVVNDDPALTDWEGDVFPGSITANLSQFTPLSTDAAANAFDYSADGPADQPAIIVTTNLTVGPARQDGGAAIAFEDYAFYRNYDGSYVYQIIDDDGPFGCTGNCQPIQWQGPGSGAIFPDPLEEIFSAKTNQPVP